MTDQIDQLTELNRLPGSQPAERLDAYRGIIDTITGYPDPKFMYARLGKYERITATELQQRCHNRLFVLSHAAAPASRIVNPDQPAARLLLGTEPRGSA